MKHRKHRWLAGTLAFLLSCSALIPSGNASFLSVVPETMAENRSVNVNLVVGERLPYPSNLGNYSTTYFTLNGYVACIGG